MEQGCLLGGASSELYGNSVYCLCDNSINQEFPNKMSLKCYFQGNTVFLNGNELLIDSFSTSFCAPATCSVNLKLTHLIKNPNIFVLSVSEAGISKVHNSLLILDQI